MMIKPPATSQRRMLETWDDFQGEAMAGISVQIRPLMPRREVNEGRLMPTRFRPEARRIVDLVGEPEMGEAIHATTEHGWLVVLGQMAQVLGLVSGLEEVPIGQRKGPKHTPHAKVIEFLVGILGGIQYLQDLNRGPHPIATDPTIAEAWR